MRKLILSAILPAILCGAAHAQLSERVVELDTSGRGSAVVDTVSYSAPLGQPVDMAIFNDKAQECIVKNVRFPDFRARDSSRSFVGGYTGRYYQFGDTSVYEGDSQVVVFVSGTKPLVVGRGRQGTGGIGGQAVQFSVAISAEADKLNIAFENIERGQQNTGSVQNTGFGVLYQAWGSGYKRAYKALDEIAADLADCMG